MSPGNFAVHITSKVGLSPRRTGMDDVFDNRQPFNGSGPSPSSCMYVHRSYTCQNMYR